jgi:hypothetical protein
MKRKRGGKAMPTLEYFNALYGRTTPEVQHEMLKAACDKYQEMAQQEKAPATEAPPVEAQQETA